MRLFLECATGLGGDMLVAALADLGVDLEPLRKTFARSGLGIDFSVEETRRNGLRGKSLQVRAENNQPMRHLKNLQEAVVSLKLAEGVAHRCIKALGRLAEVEALVHGIGVEEVHFHEVGAADTLVDVAAVFFCLDALEVEQVTCNTLPWFQGWVETAHGRLPLPSPATAELLKGKPVRPASLEDELITPTGALLVDQLVADFVRGPQGRVLSIGAGWGSRDLGEIPNMLRVFAYDPGQPSEEVWVLETNIDHLTGEEIGSVFEPLVDEGALDVIYLPGLMKKNRPGGQLQVMCLGKDLDRVEAAVFSQTLTLGVRKRCVERTLLPRSETTVETGYGRVKAKAVTIDGSNLLRPEYRALEELARRTGRSVAGLRYLLLDETGSELKDDE